jgi:hypothetical protein
MAHYPAQERVDSLQMGRVAGRPILGVKGRPYDGDPHTAMVPGARVDVVTPMREVRLWAEPSDGGIGLDLTWRARTQPYGLRRGTMRAGGELVWDQSHIFQSGTYTGTYSFDGTGYEVDGWIGQRDHSWASGTTDHARPRSCERDLLVRYHRALVEDYGVDEYPFDHCWRDYVRSSYGSLLMAVFASMMVGRTDRGDTMFMAMANRSAQMAADLDAPAVIKGG